MILVKESEGLGDVLEFALDRFSEEGDKLMNIFPSAATRIHLERRSYRFEKLGLRTELIS